jgi:hypothetical protein
MEADIERTESSEDSAEVVSSAAHEAVSWRKLAGHLHGEGRHAKGRSMSPISSTHYTLDPRTGCSSLLKCRKAFEDLRCRLKVDKWRDR